jgi:hypothetical protein
MENLALTLLVLWFHQLCSNNYGNKNQSIFVVFLLYLLARKNRQI